MKDIKTLSVTVGDYGFSHNWTLTAYGKSFYLGQDVKFCRRFLGMEPSQVIQESGIRDLRDEANLQAMAEWICKKMKLTKRRAEALEPWDLCAQ